MLEGRLLQFVQGGISVLVGTVDGEGIPACCRAVALAPRDPAGVLTVYVPVATGAETVANVATTRRIAVACSHPIDHSSVQFKGTTREVRLAQPSEEALVRERLDQFGDVLAGIGLPKAVTGAITHWPSFAIDVVVEEIFNQTPGPHAGEPLER